MITISTFNAALSWHRLLNHLLYYGREVKPRDLSSREECNVTFHVENALSNVIYHKARGLSYRFSVAEWLWMWYGRNDVKSIVQYNPNIAYFSDDGIIFNGAYGPKIVSQWNHVVDTLKEDRDSRQAIISIYDVPKGKTKDVPCTLTFQFLFRNNRLNMTVNMRSSDVWLGLPYDQFNFSMLLNILAYQLDMRVGSLTMNLGSSHLYETNYEGAEAVVNSIDKLLTFGSPSFTSPPPTWLEQVLVDNKNFEQPEDVDFIWATYSKILRADTNKDAFEFIKELS